MPKSVAVGVKAATRPYFPELDGVRAIAAVMVMVFHYGQMWHGFRLLNFGQTGVDLFFVLSGFLITMILLQAPHGDWHEIRNFYIRRTLRIFPLYYGFLILTCVLVGVVSAWYWVYLQNIVAAFHLPLNGPDHFWSLAVEEQFYLVWPFLVLFWPRRWLAHAMWATIAFSIVLRMVLVHTDVGLFYFTFTRLDGLAAGGLLAYYYQRGTLERSKMLLWVLAVVGLVSLGVENVLTHGQGLAWIQVVKYVSAAAFYAAIVGLLISTQDSLSHKALRSVPARAIGRVSYGLYVYHPLLFAKLPQHLGSLPLVAKEAICFGLVYLIALASFYGFEKRFTNLKDRLAREKPFRPVEG